MTRWRPQLVRLSYALGAAMIAGAAGTGRAAAEDIIAVYSAYWAGLPAAEIRLRLRDGGPGYRDEIEIATQGLPQLFTHFRATATAEGHRGRGQGAEPARYLAVYDLRKRHDRRISMQFVNRIGGRVAERNPDDTSRKPPLAEAHRKDALDPLSAVESLRGALRMATARGGSFSIPVYDGARRFDVVGHVLPEKGPSGGTRYAELTLRPIAGFKGESSEDGDPDDAPRKVELTVTNDDRAVPLSISVPVFFMPLVVQLQRLCVAPDPCTR
jgi:Protein of unknown function (DUF3108)